MNTALSIGLLYMIAFLVTWTVYPAVLRFAWRYGIVDRPDGGRKLHRGAVPVLGGSTVFLGIFAALGVMALLINCRSLWIGFAAMALMLALGIWDDVSNVPVGLRLAIETALVVGMVCLSGIYIDDFHGLWNVHGLSGVIAVPLSAFAGVGIINAVNLMDGVDGYSSGFGILACGLFAWMFLSCGDFPAGCFSLICAGALLPFFLHNVFGRRSKMFIGDGGTLMMGTGMAVLVFRVLSAGSPCTVREAEGLGLIPFTLSVLSVPVFDTLRVMAGRIERGRSPFHADRTHLHHLYIEMGYSHAGTTGVMTAADLLIVVVWFVSYRLGAGIDWQLYIVLGFSIVSTFGWYAFMKRQQELGTRMYRVLCRIGRWTHVEQGRPWVFLQRLVDRHVAEIEEHGEGSAR